mgnify:CR=1 FL=1
MRAVSAGQFYRVQDSDGRGPFKPGMSDRWRDPDGRDFPPAQAEFGLSWREEIPLGWHVGCAVRDIAQAARWFSPWECFRLAALGYRLVSLDGRALRESPHQVIIVRSKPLRWGVTSMPWPHMAEAALDPWKLTEMAQ